MNECRAVRDVIDAGRAGHVDVAVLSRAIHGGRGSRRIREPLQGVRRAASRVRASVIVRMTARGGADVGRREIHVTSSVSSFRVTLNASNPSLAVDVFLRDKVFVIGYLTEIFQ